MERRQRKSQTSFNLDHLAFFQPEPKISMILQVVYSLGPSQVSLFTLDPLVTFLNLLLESTLPMVMTYQHCMVKGRTTTKHVTLSMLARIMEEYLAELGAHRFLPLFFFLIFSIQLETLWIADLETMRLEMHLRFLLISARQLSSLPVQQQPIQTNLQLCLFISRQSHKRRKTERITNQKEVILFLFRKLDILDK